MRKIALTLAAAFLLSPLYYVRDTFAQGGNEKTKPILCAVLMEQSTKTLLTSVNGERVVPVGTMAKLMTVLLAAEAIDGGRLKLDDTKKTSTYANSMQGAQIWLNTGEEMSVFDLLKAVIIGNANDAAVSLAEAVAENAAQTTAAKTGEEAFAALMNAKALELGMVNTSFTNSNGFYDDDKQLSTAAEMAVLLSELAQYEFLREYFQTWMDYLRGGETQLVNSNILVQSYEGIIGFKAGYTENTGYFAAAGAVRDGETYIAVVLGSSDKELAFLEAKRMLNNGFACYQRIIPEIPAAMPETIAVKGGVEDSILLHINPLQALVIPNGTLSTVESAVILPDYIYAPAKEGDAVGEIRYYRGGILLFSTDITLASGTKKLSPLIAFGIIIKSILTF